jgi:transcriptional regulator with XRE-family HTH domain
MREHRGWTQEAVAEKLGTTQNTISRLENPKTGKPTIKTLLRIARVFDVGLLVRFVPFGFYGDVIEAMDPTHVEIPSYDEELAGEEESQEAPKPAQRERISGLGSVQHQAIQGQKPAEPLAGIRQRGRLIEMTKPQEFFLPPGSYQNELSQTLAGGQQWN